MDVEQEIRDLKAKLQAIEAVHAALIATIASVVTAPTGITSERLLKATRDSITATVTGSDPVLVERMQLLSEQFVDDAVHLIAHCMKSLDRPTSDH